MAVRGTTKYYRNLVAIGDAHELAASTVSSILRSAGVRSQPRGYPVLPVDKAIRDYKAGDLKFDGSLKDEKLRREIKLLDIEIDRELKKLIGIDEHVSDIRTLAAEIKAGLEQWLQWVAAELKDPKAYERAIAVNDRLLLMLSEKTDEPSTDQARVEAGNTPSHAA